MASKRRPQASKSGRFQAAFDPSSLFVQRVSLTQCPSTGLLSYSVRSAAQARAGATHSAVHECLDCDGYHVEGVFS